MWKVLQVFVFCVFLQKKKPHCDRVSLLHVREDALREGGREGGSEREGEREREGEGGRKGERE
jgi:hypothetical protein